MRANIFSKRSLIPGSCFAESQGPQLHLKCQKHWAANEMLPNDVGYDTCTLIIQHVYLVMDMLIRCMQTIHWCSMMPGTAAKLLDAFSWSYERWIQSPWFQQYHFTMDVDRQGGYTTTPKRPADPGWGEWCLFAPQSLQSTWCCSCWVVASCLQWNRLRYVYIIQCFLTSRDHRCKTVRCKKRCQTTATCCKASYCHKIWIHVHLYLRRFQRFCGETLAR